MSSGKKRKATSSSRGKSKGPKRITEGRLHRTKHAKLQCSQCGRWFENLGQINKHYSAVGHKKVRKPPKRIKFGKSYSQADVDLVEGLIELLKNPIEFRKKIRERLDKRRGRRVEYF